MRNQISALILGLSATVSAERLWIEGEDAIVEKSEGSRHPWWYDPVKTEGFSGGGLVSQWSAEKPGLVDHPLKVGSAGECHFWVRPDPVQSSSA
jgi:hypothetical protein